MLYNRDSTFTHELAKVTWYATGQDRNFPNVLEIARATLEGVWAEFTDTAPGDFGDGNAALPKLEAELARVEATVQAMRAQLKKTSS